MKMQKRHIRDKREGCKPLFSRGELRKAIQEPVGNSDNGIGLYRKGYGAYGIEFWGDTPGMEVRRFFELLPDQSIASASVLDIGAGTGKNIFEFIRRGVFRAVAIEIDSIAAKLLLEVLVKLENAGLVPEGNLEVVKGDAIRFMAINGEKYDIIICYGFLHVIKEKLLLGKAIDVISNAINDGGYVIFQCLTNKYPHPVSQPELQDIIVTPEILRGYFRASEWKVIDWNEGDIFHSHMGSGKGHRHGSVRAILKRSIRR